MQFSKITVSFYSLYFIISFYDLINIDHISMFKYLVENNILGLEWQK